MKLYPVFEQSVSAEPVTVAYIGLLVDSSYKQGLPFRTSSDMGMDKDMETVPSVDIRSDKDLQGLQFHFPYIVVPGHKIRPVLCEKPTMCTGQA